MTSSSPVDGTPSTAVTSAAVAPGVPGRVRLDRTAAALLAGAGLLMAGGLLGGFAARDAGSVVATDAAAASAVTSKAELAAAHAAVAKPYSIDAVHSHVVFKAMHFGASHAYGMFHAPTGSLSVDVDGKTVSDIRVVVDASKVDTGHDGRDNHLRGGDFFSAGEFPTITFVSSSTADLSDGDATVNGSLTMLGKSLPVTATVRMIGAGTHPRNGSAIAGFEADFTIKRSDFGMTYGVAQGALGDDVHLTVAIEAAAQ